MDTVMPYCSLHYHLIWATRERRPMLTPALQPTVYEILRTKAIGLGAMVHAIGGMPDHVHMAVTLPPSMAVATFVGQVKGVSSRKEHELLDPSFAWQSAYSAFTIHIGRLPTIVDYIAHQAEHHSTGTAIDALERLT